VGLGALGADAGPASMLSMAVSETLKKAAHAVGAHRIATRPFAGHVRVEREGRVLAASDRAVALDETGLPTRFYLPRADVRMDLLAPSETTSHCPFKGDATYFSAPGAKDAFWVYESPSEEDALPVAGMLAPWPGRVDVFVEGPGEPREGLPHVTSD
jgi:uncharacterized protein (DUF427 family)